MVWYRRIGFEERTKIFRLWLLGWSTRRIARKLKRAASTISRELKRCEQHPFRCYRPEFAEAQARRRWRRNPGLFRCPRRSRYVRARLRDGWSPEQVAGRLKREGSPLYVCTESIYQWAYRKRLHRIPLFSWLPQGKRERRRGTRCKRADRIPNATPIALRPEAINRRATVGHWEGDTLLAGRVFGGAVTTLVERKTRFAMLVHAPALLSGPVVRGIQQALAKIPASARASITFDRGTEFAAHERLHTSGIATYFCNPHSPWQKGAVENMNGRLRRLIPKNRKTFIDQTILDRIARRFNTTPRKCLGFLTPKEALTLQLRQNCCVRR